jgi:hypothetical protein
MLFAARAVLRQFDSVGIILFVLLGVVVSLFTLSASQRYFVSHFTCGTPLFNLAHVKT